MPVGVEIRRAIEASGEQLESLGAVVDEAPLPALDFQQELASAGGLIEGMLGAFQPGENTPPTTLAQYLEALDRRDKSIFAWEQFFEKWDILLCSPAVTTAFPHCEPGAPVLVDGHEEVYWAINAHTTLFNYTGHSAVVVPYKLDREGLPLGIQMIGKRWDDSRLVAIAQALSAVTGVFQPPPGYYPG